jgi:hypothetical protein
MSYKLETTDPKLHAVISGRIDHARAENHKDDRYSTYHYPRNKEEWWKNLEAWWPELLALINTYGCRLSNPRDPLATMEPAATELERMKQAKDEKMALILEEAWCNAPDHGSIHTNKGWDVLCDLCSESYVLTENQAENENKNHKQSNQ